MSIYSTVTIIGLGLIGSSLARIIKSAGLAEQLILTDNNPEVLAKARELGLGDHIEKVILASPLKMQIWLLWPFLLVPWRMLLSRWHRLSKMASSLPIPDQPKIGDQ